MPGEHCARVVCQENSHCPLDWQHGCTYGRRVFHLCYLQAAVRVHLWQALVSRPVNYMHTYTQETHTAPEKKSPHSFSHTPAYVLPAWRAPFH